MCHAVRVARENAAASGHGIVAGTMPRFDSGSTTSSARVPLRCSPSTWKAGQSDSSPRRHSSQVPQEMPGLIITRSPGRTAVTALPTDSTMPAPSDPTTWGKV